MTDSIDPFKTRIKSPLNANPLSSSGQLNRSPEFPLNGFVNMENTFHAFAGSQVLSISIAADTSIYLRDLLNQVAQEQSIAAASVLSSR